MRRWSIPVVVFGAELALAGAFFAACSSASGGGSGGAGGSSGDASATGGSGNTAGDSGAIDAPATDGTLNPDTGCALFVDEAKQAPAALLFVLDRSLSMNQNNLWAAAQVAAVQAVDNDAFDNVGVGLYAFPSTNVQGPACVFNLQVSCGVSGLPQVALADAGTAKSNQPGVRKQIYDWLSANSPIGTATPGYAALQAGINALKAYPLQGTRVLILLSDGGFGCTSLSNPLRDNYVDGLGCPDWEHPNNVVTLLDGAFNDPVAPVRTFVIGLPGTDTTPSDPDAPPYHMRRAMSAFALAGSPDTVPAGCDGTYLQGAGDPTVSCHFDLTQGNFNTTALANAIAEARGKALGCVYQVPDPGNGQTVDPNKVNVTITLEGTESTLPKRTDPNDTCATDGCWDYDTDGQIVLIGKACADIAQASNAKVEIVVGCTTIVK